MLPANFLDADGLYVGLHNLFISLRESDAQKERAARSSAINDISLFIDCQVEPIMAFKPCFLKCHLSVAKWLTLSE
jgi:hypothetical protein